MSSDSMTPTKAGQSAPAPFAPNALKNEQAKADAVIAYAATIMDWQMLDGAIEEKIEQQDEFVGWWREHVRRAGGSHIISDREIMYSAEEAERATGFSSVTVSRWRKELKDKKRYHGKVRLAAYRKAGLEPDENHRASGTGENEWFTPKLYIDAARAVMGSIDLDPATHPQAQRVVDAGMFYTRLDNGLIREWHGNVWLNPPYAQPLIGQFVDKLIEEGQAGRLSQAIMLTHNYTDTAWFHAAADFCQRICFTRGRIRFIDIDGEECSPTQGQALFYFGDNEERFIEGFSRFGFVR
jgi:ParB family chromosome partitioning protein